MRAKLLWGLGLGGIAAVALVIVGVGRQADAVDPVKSEATKGKTTSKAQAAAEERPAEEANQRWRQRVAERAAERAANPGAPRPGAAANNPTSNPPGSENPSHVDANGAPALQPTRDAALRDGPSGLRAGDSGSFVNARVAEPPAAGVTPGRSSNSGSSSGSSLGASNPNAKTGVVRGCGDGVLEAGEECEPASSPKCGDDCRPVVSEACYQCEVSSVCVPLASACADFMKSKIDQSLCYDVAHCIQDTGCAAGKNTLTSCFCGEMSMEQCRDAPPMGDQAPHGACADIIREAMGGASSNAAILTRYTSMATPAGAAIKRFQCLKATEPCNQVCFK